MSIDTLAAHVRRQADILFPDRTDSSMFLKLYGELGELVAAKSNQERAKELADVFILLLDYADIHGIFIEESVVNKMRINAERKWTVNELGVFSHVEK